MESATRVVALRSVAPQTATPLQQSGDFAKQFQTVVGQERAISLQLRRIKMPQL
jgi:hypothetical protein